MLDLLKKSPDLVQAQLLLADAYRSLGRLDEAASVIREQIRRAPQNARYYFLLGVVLQQQKKSDEATKAFEKAAELEPDSPLAAEQLIEMDVASKKFDVAIGRVERQLQRNPNSAAAHFMEGQIYAAQGDWGRAEAALRKSLELDAKFSAAYELLITTFIAANKVPEAISELETLLSKAPGNARALMTLGAIYERQKDYPKARDAYEKVLSKNPDFVPALNNLAYLYAERLDKLDKASELARKARTLQPADPSTADTLGWILYKQGDYQQAVTILQESADKLSDNPEVAFHLGMASYMMGQTEAARTAFQKAANAPREFPGKQESQRQLALLDKNAATSKELSIDELEKTLKQQPNDLVARMALGGAYEKQGAFDKAAETYEQALRVNPKLLSATVKLAQLNAASLQDKNKALAFAKKARELAPTDPHVSAILGKVAYEVGNFSWAYSLLQESARQLPSDAEILRDLAWAAYSIGKVSEAQQVMGRTGTGSQQTEDAKSFLAMTALDEDGKNLASAEPEVQRILKMHPDYVPALIARAAIVGQRGESNAAAEIYNDVLRRFPDFAPAQKHLALLYASNPANQAMAYDLAVKARKALPDDLELSQALAEISYERKEYARALQLLQEIARKKPMNAEALYFLGMSQLQSKQKSEGEEALKRALAGGLRDPLAIEAKRALTELQKP
jgi:tetratricopeptide (TPR) repeat protein